jgi:ubiquinone/menaquinone biosynthesis C-methylase UbiE
MEQREGNRGSEIAPETSPWEAAYLRFETPEQEIIKFKKRLEKMGVTKLPRHSHVVEIFCGRGGGLHALQQFGFTHLEGVDLSENLLRQYQGDAQLYVSDCRRMPFRDQSKDVLIVQGGLHHLLALPDDLEQTAAEVRRVLKPGGRFVIVEPWRTPFLSFVHVVCANPVARRLWDKLDALQVMTEHEIVTYEQWLSAPQLVLGVITKYFSPAYQTIGWGKLNFVGIPKAL